MGQFRGAFTDAVGHKCSVKKKFLVISHNLQENSRARVSFLIMLQTWGLQFHLKRDSFIDAFLWICEISKNTFSYRTPPVAASLFRIISRVTLLYLTGFWIRLRKHYNFLFSIPSITKMFRFKIFVKSLNPNRYSLFRIVLLYGGELFGPHPTVNPKLCPELVLKSKCFRFLEISKMFNVITKKVTFFTNQKLILINLEKFKVGLLPSKKRFYLVLWRLFENDEKSFLFQLKSSFHS